MSADMSHRDIAVIGMAFRLPGGDDPEVFRDRLLASEDCLGTWPDSIRSGARGPVRPAGIIQGVDLFDAAYFGIAPREAALTDPRRRLVLEMSATALETCGYGGDRLRGSDTGVFLGVSNNGDYGTGGAAGGLGALNVSDAMIAHEVSRFFDFTGPSQVVDTLCSSALAAVHQACCALREGRCSTALAGGVSLLLSVSHFEALEGMGLLSRSGKCRTFDVDADGFVLGEGVGVFLLKSLKAALRDGDPLWGVIKGGAVAFNGRGEHPLALRAEAVERVVTRAMRDAGTAPAAISFIETAGTGTPMGDAAEVRGLRSAFGSAVGKAPFCGLGAVKTRVGNLEAASGIAALVKTLLMMRGKFIAANLNFHRVNPLIRLKGSPFRLCNELDEWTTANRAPRRAGVSALGIGGAHYHLILEEPPSEGFTLGPSRPRTSEPLLLCLSAGSLFQLRELCRRYRRRLEDLSECTPEELCHTHNTGSGDLPVRLALTARDGEELIGLLKRGEFDDPVPRHGLEGMFFHDGYAGDIRRKRNPLKDLRSPSGEGGRADPERLAGRTGLIQGDLVSCEHPETALQSIGVSLGEWGVRVGPSISAAAGDTQPDAEAMVPDRLRECVSRGIRTFVTMGLSDDFRNRISEEVPEAFLIPWPGSGADLMERRRLAAALYAHGARLDFEMLQGSGNLRKAMLPPYPFARKSFWRTAPDDGLHKASPAGTCAAERISPEDLAGMPPSELKERVEGFLREAACESAGLDCGKEEIVLFSDWCLDSLARVQLARRVESRFGVRIDLQAFLRHDHVALLAEYVVGRIRYGSVEKPVEPREDDHRARVILETASAAHWEAVRAWLNDEGVNQWLDPFFQEGFGAREYAYFLKQRDRNTWVIVEDGIPVGICGLVQVDLRNLGAETWIVVGDLSARLRGAAVAAGEALCGKAFLELGLRTLNAKVRWDNVPALEMTEYSGWRRVGTLRNSLKVGDAFHDRELFELTREDFEDRRNRGETP